MANQSIRVPLTGEWPVPPILFLKPTAQRSAPVANAGWKWRRRIAVHNGADEPLVNYPYALHLGDTTPLTTTKALASGNDVRVAREGLEVPRTLVDWDSATHGTLCWITLPYQQPGETVVYDVLYGNAAAGAPPTLTTMVDRPAFDLSLVGAARCDNDLWIWSVNPVAANAGKGAWSLDAGQGVPRHNMFAPGSWLPEMTFQATDDRQQNSFTVFTDGGTDYVHSIFDARRARFRSEVITGDRGPDGVTLQVPTGILALTTDFIWTNQAISESDARPIGRLVVAYAERQGDTWVELAQWTGLADAEAIASDTYTFPTAVKRAACAVWPSDEMKVVGNARSDRYVEARWATTIRAEIDDSLVTQTVMQAETEVYEIANEVRVGGGAYGEGPFGTYQVARLGNSQLASGAGTRRLAVQINQQVKVNNERRTVEVVDSAGTTKVEDVPLNAVSFMESVLRDLAFVEQPDADWLYLMPVRNPLTNPSFDVNATGWTPDSGSVVRVTDQFTTAPAAARMTISGLAALAYREVAADDFLPVGDQPSIWWGVDLRVADIDFRPALQFRFYDEAQVIVGSFVTRAATALAAINAWERHIAAAVPPAGAIYWKPAIRWVDQVGGNNANVWWDTVGINEPELAVYDPSLNPGTLQLNYSMKPRMAYA